MDQDGGGGGMVESGGAQGGIDIGHLKRGVRKSESGYSTYSTIQRRFLPVQLSLEVGIILLSTIGSYIQIHD